MLILEAAKRILEAGTGLARPSPHELKELVRARKPNLFRFADDGETPNNPHWPLVLYRSPVRLQRGLDPAAIFEDLFAANGWTDSWRDGIYDFCTFTRTDMKCWASPKAGHWSNSAAGAGGT